MVGESNQNVFLIQIDASSFAEFEISRVDCIFVCYVGRGGVYAAGDGLLL